MEDGQRRGRCPPEVRARAVRLVPEHAGDHGARCEAIVSVSGKIGRTAETPRRWVRRAERDDGSRPGATSAERSRIRDLSGICPGVEAGEPGASAG